MEIKLLKISTNYVVDFKHGTRTIVTTLSDLRFYLT